MNQLNHLWKTAREIVKAPFTVLVLTGVDLYHTGSAKEAMRTGYKASAFLVRDIFKKTRTGRNLQTLEN